VGGERTPTGTETRCSSSTAGTDQAQVLKYNYLLNWNNMFVFTSRNLDKYRYWRTNTRLTGTRCSSSPARTWTSTGIGEQTPVEQEQNVCLHQPEPGQAQVFENKYRGQAQVFESEHLLE